MTTIDNAIPVKPDSMSVQAVDLSVVVVNWNTRELLRDCVASVLANAGKLSLELFVVDNASSDGSAEMIDADFPTIKLIRNDRNRGFAAANNQALRLAVGRQLLLLNSDTIVLQDVLEKSVKYMDERPDVGVMGCRVLNPDRTLQPTCFQYPGPLNLFLLASGLSHLPWPRFFGRYNMVGWNRDTERDVQVVTGCFMLVRQTALRDVGLLDESFFFFGEETDWCKCLKMHGWHVRFAPVGEIIHHGGASTKTFNHRRDVLCFRAIVDFNRKHGGPIAAFAAWAFLWVYSFTRYLGWTLASLANPKGRAPKRREHFRGVLKEFPRLRATTNSVAAA